MPNKRADGLVMARIWVPEELWLDAKAVLDVQDTDRSKAIVQYLRWLTGDPKAELPTPAERKES